jgi:hypothetical protein
MLKICLLVFQMILLFFISSSLINPNSSKNSLTLRYSSRYLSPCLVRLTSDSTLMRPRAFMSSQYSLNLTNGTFTVICILVIVGFSPFCKVERILLRISAYILALSRRSMYFSEPGPPSQYQEKGGCKRSKTHNIERIG